MNFPSRAKLPQSARGEPIRTFLWSQWKSRLQKSQSHRRCHWYGPVRAPASWFLGGRRRGHFGGDPLGITSWLAAFVSGAPARISRFAGPTVERGCRSAARRPWNGQPQPLHSAAGSKGPRDAAAGPPPAYTPTNGTSPLSPQQTRKVRLELKGPAPGGHGRTTGSF